MHLKTVHMQSNKHLTVKAQAKAVIDARRVAFNKDRSQSRAARRLAARVTTITLWWNSQLFQPEYMTPKCLAIVLRQPMRRMAAALRWLGWHQITRRIGGKPLLLWIPPSSTLTVRSACRPRVYAS